MNQPNILFRQFRCFFILMERIARKERYAKLMKIRISSNRDSDTKLNGIGNGMGSDIEIVRWKKGKLNLSRSNYSTANQLGQISRISCSTMNTAFNHRLET